MPTSRTSRARCAAWPGARAVAAGIGTAAEELARDYEAVAADFAEFFPELRAHCEAFLAAPRA